MSEFKYLGCVLDESGSDEVEYRRKLASGKMVTGANRSIINAGICTMSVVVLHKTLLVLLT